MTKEDKIAIEYASSFGMNYHVFCDIASYDDRGRYTGKHQYRTSFATYEPARKLASSELNGIVYNSLYQKI